MVVVIKMRGLPYDSSARDIREFYRGLEIKEDEIHLAPNEDGRASGVAFAIFLNDDDARKAMYRDGRYIGKRYVNLFLSSVHEMQKILREGVHERRKNPTENSTEPTASANKHNLERNKSGSAQIRSRGEERNERTSRNLRENYRSDRSRSPLRSRKDERRRTVTCVSEAHDGNINSRSASSGLDELQESHRLFEQPESLRLLQATLSDYELLELERQLAAAVNKDYRDFDFKSTLLGQESTVSFSRLSQEKLYQNPWEFHKSYEPNFMGTLHEDSKSDLIHDRVAEALNHNIDSLVCKSDLGLGRITTANNLYHGNVVGGHGGDQTMIAADGFNYAYEKIGEVLEQNLGQEKMSGGQTNPLILDYGKLTRGQDHDADQERLQVRKNQSHERENGRRDQSIGSERVLEEHDHNYKRGHKGREHDHACERDKSTIGNDRKYERLNRGHDRNQEKVPARGNHHASDHIRARKKPEVRKGKAFEGQKSGNEKEVEHRGHNDSHNLGYRNIHIKRESKTSELDRVSERQKGRHDHGYSRQKINHNDHKTSGGYDLESAGGISKGTKQNFKIDDESDESRGICINMVGLPYSCTEAEVAEFFKGLRIIRIHLRRNLSGPHIGKTNGEAFVVFGSLEDCMVAVERNHQYIRSRYVKVRKCPKEVMYDAIQQEVNVFGVTVGGELPSPVDYPKKDLNQELDSQVTSEIGSETRLGNVLPPAFNYPISHPGMDANPSFQGQEMIHPTMYGYINESSSGQDIALSQLAQGANINVSDIKAGCVVGIRNLPSTVTADEILDFFYGFRVIPDSIRIHYLAPGRSSGDAIVTFKHEKEARIAMEQLNHKPVGRRNVQLFPV